MPRPAKELRVWEPFLIGICAAIGLLAGYNMNFDSGGRSLLKAGQQQFIRSDGRIEEVIRFIETTYVDSIDSKEMALNVIDDMLQNLDPHSSY